jgi:hypothetical protein
VSDTYYLCSDACGKAGIARDPSVVIAVLAAAVAVHDHVALDDVVPAAARCPRRTRGRARPFLAA